MILLEAGTAVPGPAVPTGAVLARRRARTPAQRAIF
jgi:hypothetical protein